VGQVLLIAPRVIFACRVATTSRECRKGLLRRSRLQPTEAVLFPNATSVHTFGMRFPILVVRLDDALRVVDVRRVRPWRFVPPTRRARHVLECHEDADVRMGDAFRLRSIGDSAGDGADERKDERRDDRQDDDDDRHEASRPRRERHWLASRGVRLDYPEELQQGPHR
jgi:uncharacterized membrane protein (UPF0127 family)